MQPPFSPLSPSGVVDAAPDEEAELEVDEDAEPEDEEDEDAPGAGLGGFVGAGGGAVLHAVSAPLASSPAWRVVPAAHAMQACVATRWFSAQRTG